MTRPDVVKFKLIKGDEVLTEGVTSIPKVMKRFYEFSVPGSKFVEGEATYRSSKRGVASDEPEVPEEDSEGEDS